MGRPAACRSGGRQRFGICARVRQVVTEEEPPGKCSDGTSGFGLLGFGFLGFGFLDSGLSGLEVVRMSWRSSGRTSEPTGGWNSLGWNSLGWDSLAGANRRGPRPPARKLPSGQSGWRRGSVPPAFPAEEEPADPERSRIPLRPEGRRDCGSLLSRPPERDPDSKSNQDAGRGGFCGVWFCGFWPDDAGPRQQAPALKTELRNQPFRRSPPDCRQAGQVPISQVLSQEPMEQSGRLEDLKFRGEICGSQPTLGESGGKSCGVGEGEIGEGMSAARARRGQGFVASRVFSRRTSGVQRGVQRIWRRNSTTLPRIRQDPGGGRSVLKAGFSGRSSIPSRPR